MTLRELDITKATVVRSPGTDLVILQTTTPGPFPIGAGNKFLSLEFETPYGKGEIYLLTMFGLKAEVIDYEYPWLR